MKPAYFLICFLDILELGLAPHETELLKHTFEKKVSKTKI